MARPRADDYDDKRRAILDASARLFAENGYDRTTMSLVAEACGVSKALLYHYYAGKDELINDIITTHLERLTAAVRRADPGAGAPPPDRLTRLVTALLDAYRDATAHHIIQINDLKRLSPPQQDAIRCRERTLVAIFSDAIAAANPHLANGSGLLKPVTMSLFGMLNWHYLWFRDGGAVSREDYAALATRIIVEGTRGL